MIRREIPFCTLASLLSAFSAGIVHAAEPPACDDEKMLLKVRMQYELAVTTTVPFTLEVQPAMTLGEPPAAANQYATATTFVEISRYCQGIVGAGSATPDPIWWRIDAVKDGADSYVRVRLLFGPARCPARWLRVDEAPTMIEECVHAREPLALGNPGGPASVFSRNRAIAVARRRG